MTKDKVQKKSIRARMTKTGERYTTARRYALDLHHVDAVDPVTPSEPDEPVGAEFTPVSPPATDFGVSDDAVRQATGKSWPEWLALLDAWGGREQKHPEIARFVSEEHGVDGWWAQTVTVGYERARGMRAVHQRPDGLYSASASKTMAVPVERLYAAFVEETERDRWLEPGELRLRTSQPNRSARFDLAANDTRLGVIFTARSPEKSTAQLQHEKLPTAEDVDSWRAHWKARLDRLATILTNET